MNNLKRMHLVLAAVCAAPLPAGAAVLLQDDFNDGDAAGWTRMQESIFSGPQSYDASGGAYHVTLSPVTPSYFATGGHSYYFGFRPEVTYTDFVQSVDLVDSAGVFPMGGMLARYSAGVFNNGVYDIHTGGGYGLFTFKSPSMPGMQALDLVRITGGVDEPSTAQIVYFPGDATGQYRLTLEGRGSGLTGSIFSLNDLSAPLATVSLNDSTYAGGYGGIGGFDLMGYPIHAANVGTSLTFDNFRVSSVPEGGGGGLLALSSLLLAGAARFAKSGPGRAG